MGADPSLPLGFKKANNLPHSNNCDNCCPVLQEMFWWGFHTAAAGWGQAHLQVSSEDLILQLANLAVCG